MNYLTIAEWAQKGCPSDAVLKKQVSAQIIKQAGKPLQIVISSQATDRDNDSLTAAGVRLENYRRNPVVLWSHEYRELPIARAPKTWVDGTQIISQPEFVPPEIYPFADTVRLMLENRFLNAASVGFRPLKHAYNDERHGYDFSEWELLEWSVINVPAHQDALVMRGVNESAVKAWLRNSSSVLDDGDEGPLTDDEIRAVLRELPRIIDQVVGRELEAHTGRLFDPEPDILMLDDEIELDLTPAEVRGAVKEAVEGELRDRMTEWTGKLD